MASEQPRLLQEGDKFGDYTVVKLLGKGGMGAVYLAHASDGTCYAVKVMDADAAQGKPDFHKRFIREGEFAVKIRHPNLIPVHCIGQDPKTGLCYLVMDYMPGGSLADRLGERKRFPVDEAVAIVTKIAEALEVAHRHGVIHRDVKPDNIMFDADGTPKLADLGVAKFTDDAHKTTVTTTGMIIGTPAYMAPEQMIDSRHIDARADVYALGVVLYEMLAGKRPNEGSTAVELLVKQVKNPSGGIVGGAGKARRKWTKEFIGSAFAVLFCMVLATMFLRTPTENNYATPLSQKVSPCIAAKEPTWNMADDSIKADFSEADFREKSLPSRVATKATERTIQVSSDQGEDVGSAHGQKHVVASTRMTHRNRIQNTAADVKFASVRDGVTSNNATWRDRNERGQSIIKSTSAQTAVLTPAAAADSVAMTNSRPRMVVLPFRLITCTNGTSSSEERKIDSIIKHVGEEFANALNNELVRTRSFTMFDRSFSDEMVAEFNRLNIESISADDLIRFQQRLPSDYIVTGTVKIYEVSMATISPTKRVFKCECGIGYRVVSIASARTIIGGYVRIPCSMVNDVLNETVLASKISEASQGACHSIIKSIFPMRVTAKTKSELVLNQGGMNIRVGEKLNVFWKGAMLNITTGELLDSPEKKIATIRVARVHPEMCYAVVVEGMPLEQIPVGAIVRSQNGLGAPAGEGVPVKQDNMYDF